MKKSKSNTKRKNTTDTTFSNTDSKTNSDSDFNSDSDSDSDLDSDSGYVNLKNLLDEQKNNIYQLQINNENLTIKHIGRGSHVPDIIIKEDFGKENKLSLYSCVYSGDEIDFLRKELSSDKILPIIKLIEKAQPHNNIYTLSVKINCIVEYNRPFHLFDTFVTYSTNNTHYESKLEKNISSSNIVEKLLEKIVDAGFDIL